MLNTPEYLDSEGSPPEDRYSARSKYQHINLRIPLLEEVMALLRARIPTQQYRRCGTMTLGHNFLSFVNQNVNKKLLSEEGR